MVRPPFLRDSPEKLAFDKVREETPTVKLVQRLRSHGSHMM